MPTAAMMYALIKSRQLLYFSQVCVWQANPLLMFNHFGAYAVKSIADATELRMMLTQTWAYAHAAEAKKLDTISRVCWSVDTLRAYTPALDVAELL